MSDANSTTPDSHEQTLLSLLGRMLKRSVHTFLTLLQTSHVAVSSFMERHWQAISRANREQNFRFDLMTRYQTQSVALREGRQNQLGLHHGKVIADA